MSNQNKDNGFKHINGMGLKFDLPVVRADERVNEPFNSFEEYAHEFAVLILRGRASLLCPSCLTNLEMAVPQAIANIEEAEYKARIDQAAALANVANDDATPEPTHPGSGRKQ